MLTRRELVKLGLGLGASVLVRPRVSAQTGALIQRKIPSSGESVPAVGIGTARRYDVGPTPEERAVLKEVLRQFPQMGGRIIDTAPSYGAAETVVGDLVAEIGNRNALFIGTKVGANGREAGIAQLEQSFKRLRTDKVDLIAVHNLRDTPTQLATLREWKAAGRIRYIGVTSTAESQYPELERTLKAETLDFVQVDYALDVRRSGERILPAAADRGVAVMTALPFGRGRLFQAVQGKELPAWAKEFDCQSWAQFFLKYIISNPAVTVAIPGTARVEYLVDNLGAARGRLPDAEGRRRMETFIDSV